MGISLMAMYGIYMIVLINANKNSEVEDDDDDDDDVEYSNDGQAWKDLTISVVHLGLACGLLTHSVVEIASGLGS